MADKKLVAMVTGGASGIGKAISTRLAKDGLKVCICDYQLDRAEALADELNKQGFEAYGVYADVSKYEDVNAAFDKLISKFGRIDVLANNAGLGGNLPFFEATLEEWRKMMSVNIDAVLFCAQRAAKEMIKQGGGGKIIITTSQASFTQDHDAIAYCTSKWGARGVMRSLASALAPHGITVNAVCPGAVWTEMIDKFYEEFNAATGKSAEEYKDIVAQTLPLKRWQSPEDVAAVYSFIIRDGKTISGQSLLVAGGMAYS